MSKEKVYVVDENDNILEEKWRDELTDSDCWRIIAVWVENSRGEILIQQRSKEKKLNPGLWTAGVIGTVTSAETYEEAAYKELGEELGVSDVHLALRAVSHYKASVGYRNIHTFHCTVDRDVADFTIQEEEVEQVRWISPEELSQELKDYPERFTIPELWEEVYGFTTT